MYQTLSESIYVSMNRIWCYFEIKEVLRATPSSKTILSGKIYGRSELLTISHMIIGCHIPTKCLSNLWRRKEGKRKWERYFCYMQRKTFKNKKEDDSDGGNQQEEIYVIAGRQHFLETKEDDISTKLLCSTVPQDLS